MSGPAAADLLTGTLSVLLARTFDPVLTRTAAATAALDPSGRVGPVTVLVVGNDRRPDRVGSRRDIRGDRADAVMLCVVGGGWNTVVLSLPRDLRVTVPGHGDGKLGGSLDYGPAAVVAAVRGVTGVPVQHYVEVRFAAVARVVDRLGGIRLDLAAPVRDRASGLHLAAGPQRVGGSAALAWLRSREPERLVAGRWVADSPGDIGRIDRQHVLLAAVVAAVARADLPTDLGLAAAAHGSVTVDDGLRGRDLAIVVAALRGAERWSWSTLPTEPELDPATAFSPFPPAHAGSVGYRRTAAPADAILRALRARTTLASVGALP